jgi:hypothetical protein
MQFSFLICINTLSSTCFEKSNYSSPAGSYCIWQLLYMAVTVYGSYCIWQLLYMSVTVYGSYCIWHLLYMAVTVYGSYCIRQLLYTAVTVYGSYCIWQLLYTQYMAFTMHLLRLAANTIRVELIVLALDSGKNTKCCIQSNCLLVMNIYSIRNMKRIDY